MDRDEISEILKHGEHRPDRAHLIKGLCIWALSARDYLEGQLQREIENTGEGHAMKTCCPACWRKATLRELLSLLPLSPKENP